MKEINIAQIIIDKRKEKGITQAQLATFMQVSKASVSKWETTLSYPDITLLPRLASFFNISVDELIGYQPYLTQTEIKTLYLKLTQDFAALPFDDVMAQVNENINKYYACFPLLLQMAILMINHCALANDPQRIQSLIKQSKALFYKIKSESNDVELIKQAQHLEAYCALIANQPEEVLSLLGEKMPLVISSEILLSSAYQMLNKKDQAVEVLQFSIYQYLLITFDLLTTYLSIVIDDVNKYEQIVKRNQAIAQAFNLQYLHPTSLFKFYITAAQGYIQQENKTCSLEMLSLATQLLGSGIFPLKLKTDDFFDEIEDFFLQLDLGNSLPRNDNLVKRDMLELITKNPAFTCLHDNIDFQNITFKLKQILKEQEF